MINETFVRSESGSGVVNADVVSYQKARARKKQDKYIKGLEQRIEKLESAMLRLENTVNEITK
jgi:hypothetical protein